MQDRLAGFETEVTALRSMCRGVVERHETGALGPADASIVKVPAQYWNPATPFIRTIELPPFPVSNLQLLTLFNETFQELSGRPDVLSGKTPTPDAK